MNPRISSPRTLIISHPLPVARRVRPAARAKTAMVWKKGKGRSMIVSEQNMAQPRNQLNSTAPFTRYQSIPFRSSIIPAPPRMQA